MSRGRITFLLAAAVTAAAVAEGARPAPSQPMSIGPEALRQIEALQSEKASRTAAQRKISSRLLFEMRRRAILPDLALPKLESVVEVDRNGEVLVDLAASVTAGLLGEIDTRGGTVVSAFRPFDLIRARFPLVALEDLAAAPEVRFIRPTERPIHNKINSSQGDVAHAADQARTMFGVDGRGIRIGVLSDSVDQLAVLQTSGDLPPVVTVLEGQDGAPGTSEGTAMLEIVFDLAPGAELLFATAKGGQAQMAHNILDLHAAGCEILVDDVFYLAEPVFQDGPIAQAVETSVAGGALYFSSAGNGGNLNDGQSGVWEGDFLATAGPPVLPGTLVHDFGAGFNYNPLLATAPFGVILQWSDPWGTSANDYDLYLLDPTLSVVLDASTDAQDGAADPIEQLGAGSTVAGNSLVISKTAGSANRYLHLNTVRGRLLIATDGQTAGHAAAASAFGVAAVWVGTAVGGSFTGGASNPVETFSSDGPRRVFYRADGTPITPDDFSSTGGELRLKPDLAAADGVATATQPEVFFSPFFGTSAAAAHAAAIAALIQEKSNLTTSGLQQVLAATALDIEAPGRDRDSGWGILQARDAVGTTVPTAFECTTEELVLTGRPNDGPQTFRACKTLRASDGVFDEVTGLAETVALGDGFVSAESVWSNDLP